MADIEELTLIEVAILKAMQSRDLYGKNHKKVEKITRSGFPSHLRGEVKKSISSLIKKGFVQWYHRADKSIQLNKERLAEIEEIVSK